MLKKLFTVVLCLVVSFACQQKQKEDKMETKPSATDASPYAKMLGEFKPMDMEVDFSELTPSEKEVLHKLGLVAEVMDRLYLKQVCLDNEKTREAIQNSNLPHKDDLLALFDLHFGPWDSIDNDKPFFGDKPKPAGAGVYPPDMTKKEFNAWIEAHPKDKDAFTSLYTVIVRDGDGLKAVPYSQFYKKDIDEIALLLEEASEISENDSLKNFLKLRAEAFRTDSYRESEMAWMDLNGRIEVAVGPYEVYTDRLFGYKAFFEIFLTIRNSEESAKLDKYKSYLADMEKNLPIPDEDKNLNRGSESPLAVVDQVAGGGDNKPGVQTIAFNLPNDEVVREKKGSKKVMLKNVMKAKYQAILEPMTDYILDEQQRPMLDFEYFFLETLFHEMSHGLGPGTIMKDGKQTTVGAELQETYSKMEEGKADVMGVYNLFFMMKKGELPSADKEKLMATYFAGLFRSMRFGVHEAHGGGAAFQYNFYKEKGAFTYNPETKRYLVDFPKMEAAVTELVNKVCMIQARGDYDAAKAFLASYAVEPPEVQGVVDQMQSIPVDIKPKYQAL